MERKGVITMGGNPMTLIGPELKVGDKAPAFTLHDMGLAPVTLGDFSGKVKIISVTPSIDTPVCDAQAHQFNEDAAALGRGVVSLNVSMDLPFALGRYCAAEGIDSVKTLSDYYDASFGSGWGVLIKELRLLCRAVFVLDDHDVIRYAQIVPEVTHAVDFDAALKAAKKLL